MTRDKLLKRGDKNVLQPLCISVIAMDCPYEVPTYLQGSRTNSRPPHSRTVINDSLAHVAPGSGSATSAPCTDERGTQNGPAVVELGATNCGGWLMVVF